MKNIYCIGVTGETRDRDVYNWNSFIKSNHNTIIINDITRDNNKKTSDFTFTESDLKNQFKVEKAPAHHYWNQSNNRTIAWFYAHFRILNFYKSNLDYDYYWMFDGDLQIENIELFLEGTKESKADFLSYFCFKNSNIDQNTHIPKLEDPARSADRWFGLFPGPKDILPDNCDLYGSFFPSTRLSNRALQILLASHEAGFNGYHEGYVPTMLNYKGLVLDTIINPDNTSKFFDVEKVNIKHSNITVTWDWI